MKLLLENWRKLIIESAKDFGQLNTEYSGYVELYSPYSQNKATSMAGAPGDQVEILRGWSDKGVEWKLIDIDGIKGWVLSNELDLNPISEEVEIEQNLYSFDYDNTLIRYHTLEDGDVEYLGPHEENIALGMTMMMRLLLLGRPELKPKQFRSKATSRIDYAINGKIIYKKLINTQQTTN